MIAPKGELVVVSRTVVLRIGAAVAALILLAWMIPIWREGGPRPAIIFAVVSLTALGITLIATEWLVKWLNRE